MRLIAKQDTVLTKSADQSTPTDGLAKSTRAKGAVVEIVKTLGDRIKGKQQCQLSGGAGDWFLFCDHFDGWTAQKPEFVKGLIKYSDGRESPVSIPQGFVQKGLGVDDYQKIAQEFNIDVRAVRAIVDVESAGSGFNLNESSPCRPKILFEGQWFSKFTDDRYNNQYPDISSYSWDEARQYYNQNQWNRLIKAYKIDSNAALRSASWGLGQVMGFNFAVAGCGSIEQFVTEAFTSEYHQLRHMMGFIKSNNLLGFIRNQNWTSLAYHYNGESFRANQYDTRLAQAFSKY